MSKDPHQGDYYQAGPEEEFGPNAADELRQMMQDATVEVRIPPLLLCGGCSIPVTTLLHKPWCTGIEWIRMDSLGN